MTHHKPPDLSNETALEIAYCKNQVIHMVSRVGWTDGQMPNKYKNNKKTNETTTEIDI